MLLVSIRCGNNMAELYTTLKIIHILTGSVLFASFFAVGLYSLCQRTVTQQLLILTRNISWFVSLPTLLIQMITGLAVIGVKHYALQLPWVIGTFIGFACLIISWLTGAFCLMLAINQPKPYYHYWQYSLYTSFVILLIMLFFMSSAG